MERMYSHKIHGSYFSVANPRAVPHRYTTIINAVLSAREGQTVTSVLEVGPEHPAVSKWVTTQLRITSDRYVALEISKPAALALSSSGVNVVIHDASSRSLPFPDSHFDIVIASEVIEHLLDPDRFLDEVHRVLNPTGVLALTTPNLAAWYNRIILLAGLQPVMTETGTEWNLGWGTLRPRTRPVGHLRLFTLKSLLEFSEYHGFAKKRLRGLPMEVGIGSNFLTTGLDRVFSVLPSLSSGILLVATPE
jgi:SAM-dependent methyltransferase